MQRKRVVIMAIIAFPAYSFWSLARKVFSYIFSSYGQLMPIKTSPELKLLMLTDISPRKKSSCVARERRTQINQTLCELGALLCPDQDRLDKLTVVRLAAATIKLHAFLKGLRFFITFNLSGLLSQFSFVQNLPTPFSFRIIMIIGIFIKF